MRQEIFIPDEEQKVLAEKIAFDCVEAIDSQTDDVYLKAFVLRCLIEGFEETFNIDVYGGSLLNFKDE